jgi:hypothetical protein
MEHFDFCVILLGCKANDIELVSAGCPNDFFDVAALYNVDRIGNRGSNRIFVQSG